MPQVNLSKDGYQLLDPPWAWTHHIYYLTSTRIDCRTRKLYGNQFGCFEKINRLLLQIKQQAIAIVKWLRLDPPHFCPTLLWILNEHLTRILYPYRVAVICPRSKFHNAGLFVEGEILDIDLAKWFVDGRRLPNYFTSMMKDRFGHDRYFVIPVCTVRV